MSFHSGYVTILGVPNVGKSTLINALIGEKISIVTNKPQTTRHRILGIMNRPGAQVLFLDTPGIHQPGKLLNEKIVETALRTVEDADVVLHLIFPKKNLSTLDREIAAKVQNTRKPYLVLINKIDETSKDQILPVIDAVQNELKPAEIIPISALTGDGVSRVIEAIIPHLPEGPAYYPKDVYTEHDLRFLTAEIVREKAMHLLQQELPYSLTTQVEAFHEEEKLDRIHVSIIVEKASQKGIVIGAKGSMIKKIGELARKEIQTLVGKKVYLELFVKVVDNWTKKEQKLKEFGIT